MDPAEVNQLRETLARHGQALTDFHNQLTALTAAVQSLSPVPPPGPADLPVPPPAAPAAAVGVSSREPHVSAPERFGGESEGCRGFLAQCSFVFSLQPSSFPSEVSRVGYVITLLKGRALQWANALWERQSEVCFNFKLFSEEMKRIFDHPAQGRDVATRLLNLRQGRGSVAEYTLEFRVLAAETAWPEDTLLPTFIHGLSEELKDELAAREVAGGLEAMISLALSLDARLRERRRERSRGAWSRAPSFADSFREAPRRGFPPINPSASSTARQVEIPSEPMQLGRTHLAEEERGRRMRERRCFFCGGSGHVVETCPERALKDRAYQ